MNATPTQTKLKIRWMIRCDMEEVLEIEQLCFEFPWSGMDFVAARRQLNCVAMVAEVGEGKDRQILGYMVYELYKKSIHVTNLAVESSTWRRGVGRALIEKLQAKLSPQRRMMITTLVGERNTNAQLFFKALGFQATSVSREFFQKSDLTAVPGYHFRFLHEEGRG